MNINQSIKRIGYVLGGAPYFEKYLTILFYGPRSAGKSLHQAKTARSILLYLEDLYTGYPELPQAIVISNQVFNTRIEKAYLGTRLFYWENIRQLRFCPRENCWKNEYEAVMSPNGVPFRGRKIPHRLHDCYIIFDDIATIIPADGWADLPKWFRKTFAQAGHNGIHIIANIQDPVSCDINFRRYVDVCVKFKKLFGNRRPEDAKPPVKWIWGAYSTRTVGADELFKNGDMTEEEIQKYLVEHPEMQGEKWSFRWHWIWRKDTEIYNTLQNVPEYMPDSLEHIEKRCTDPKCKFIHVSHRAV